MYCYANLPLIIQALPGAFIGITSVIKTCVFITSFVAPFFLTFVQYTQLYFCPMQKATFGYRYLLVNQTVLQQCKIFFLYFSELDMFCSATARALRRWRWSASPTAATPSTSGWRRTDRLSSASKVGAYCWQSYKNSTIVKQDATSNRW